MAEYSTEARTVSSKSGVLFIKQAVPSESEAQTLANKEPYWERHELDEPTVVAEEAT